MKIVEPGLLTTVQDLGRPGFQSSGVTPGGAMDRVALRVANRLVGNPDGAAGLEVTVRGPRIEFTEDALIAIAGGDLSPKIADVSIPGWRALLVRAGTSLSFGAPRWGARAYLAIAGGIDVPDVLGSKSTYLRAGVGGFEGRPLHAGDEVPLGEPGDASRSIAGSVPNDTGPMSFALTEKRLDAQTIRALYDRTVLRTVSGCEMASFPAATISAFFDVTFRLQPTSDRMGYRLGGHRLDAGGVPEMLSRGVATGSVQVPPGGEPIVLMADRQTTGGYPVIADVIAADHRLLAQRKPGDKVRFERVTLEEAHAALHELEDSIDAMATLEHARD